MVIMKITKGSVLSIIVIISIIVFTGGVIAEETISSTSNAVFDVFLPSPTCIIDGSESYWKEPGGVAESSEDNCFRADGINQQGFGRSDCCPINYECDDNNCVPDDLSGNNPMNVATCDDYSESREDCERDAYHPDAAINDIDSIIDLTEFPGGCEGYDPSYGSNGLCYQSLRCECRWNPTTQICGAEMNLLIEAYERPPHKWWDLDNNREGADDFCDATSVIRKTGACTFYPTIKNDCSEGDDFLVRTWKAVYENDIINPNCENDLYCQNHDDLKGSDFYCNPDGICAANYCKTRDEIIPCDKVARLPFFSLQNIIIAIILLVIIYYFILKKKKK